MKPQDLVDSIFQLPMTVFWWRRALPSTVTRIVVRPWSLPQYVIEQTSVEPDKRYSDLLSPFVTYFLCSLLPMWLTILVAGWLGLGETRPSLMFMYTHHYMTPFALGLMLSLGPALASTLMMWGQERHLSRDNFQRAMEIQFYALAPLGLILFPAFWAMLLLDRSTASTTVHTLLWVAIAYTAYAEACVTYAMPQGNVHRFMRVANVVFGGICVWPPTWMFLLNLVTSAIG